jgi:Anti-sigma-28 factor, FlgM
MLMLDIYHWISQNESHGVRWEKVERIKRLLTGGTYSVAPKQVAAKLLERMLDCRRASRRWKRNITGETNGNFNVSEAAIACRSETNNCYPNPRKRKKETDIAGKVIRRGTFHGYEVTGWRYLEDVSWHIKVWPVGGPSGWIGYTVTAGIFELTMVAQAHREAILHVIGEWEGEQTGA